MSGQFNNPLNDTHYQQLQQCGNSCAETRELLRRMREAGVPAEQAEHTNEQQASMAKGIKQQFFPGLP